jgi:hypothetical protein
MPTEEATHLREQIDPRDPQAGSFVASLLERPRPIAEVEEIERVAKDAWAPVLATGAMNEEDSIRFSLFFADIGFLRKYKPYGVKFAAPFGYSIFDLKPQSGFSVQLHREAKVEAFHILAPSEGSFVLLAELDEWREVASEFLSAWHAGSPTASSLAYAPAPGDVFVVDDLKVVHTIIGCLLEEFATTSNDAVERLYDQNSEVTVKLPVEHADIRQLLRTHGSVRPTRVISRVDGAWMSVPISETDGHPLIDESRQGIRGWHSTAYVGSQITVASPADRLTTIACLHGEADLAVGGRHVASLGAGSTVPVPPSGEARITTQSECRVALTEVAVNLALGDFRTL